VNNIAERAPRVHPAHVVCPVEAAKQLAKTKAQKKNEKRKAKRTDDKGGDADTSSIATSLKNVR
jgi:hypothetical protein